MVFDGELHGGRGDESDVDHVAARAAQRGDRGLREFGSRRPRVASDDDDIDHLYRRIFDELIELMSADPDNVDRGTRLLFAAYYTERIGDRVTNIAEDVVYLASGKVEDLNP